MPQAMAELDIIGSDVEHFSCPHCRSHDRERHLFMYFDKILLWEKFRNSATLHFAPERELAERIRKLDPKIYIKADLYPASQDIVREDITKLSFNDETFDVLIANHILEHVPDDAAAMKEIFRVLRPGGIAILQTPFSNRLETTYEDAKISSDADRFEAYGQEDHVRLYGRDIFQKIESAGFKSLVKTHEQLLSGIDYSLFGVNYREPFFCFQRPISTG
jgi:predicted SAM-dependent methyltransferase